MSPPEVITDPAKLRQRISAARPAGKRVALVPTMGALHAGHVSLVEAARRDCGVVITSIFVNPTQFAPGEDYERYPRNLEGDCALLGPAGCSIVFAPSVETMYPAGSETSIDVGSVARPLEGESRPTHFAGVATVVMKLFQLAPADAAYFGRKDYQQTLVVERMVRDLNVPIELAVCPIVREPDGLAMSSRNAYLSPEERCRALAIHASLRLAEQLVGRGERDAQQIREAALALLAESDITPEYVAIVREGTLEPLEVVEGPAVIAIAARVGKTRLIDNLILQ
ncbi:Pantoate-beta-alanine ligase [Posidoniimonas corsicana]|uniref:Pantothenate synthetase n=1 Tax=Posidoniimonas corsicana TaxID=1938618 RepID=A0A5C5V1K3_9BACT|nr:pantoate--beta-alanine ligase [Posidoniimonas corsicana]TWT32484.1 Pantoate-beta-alanine ligase [Posidoniimonas corsicana]